MGHTPARPAYGGAKTSLTPRLFGRPDGWEEHETEMGDKYYYNAATGRTTWSLPAHEEVQSV